MVPECLEQRQRALDFAERKGRETTQRGANNQSCKVDEGCKGVEKEQPEPASQPSVELPASVSTRNVPCGSQGIA